MAGKSPKMGRPTDDPKTTVYQTRLSKDDREKLEYASRILKITMADVVRQGIEEMYEKAKKEEKK